MIDPDASDARLLLNHTCDRLEPGSEVDVEGVRNVAYQVYRVLIALIAIACVVQIFLAGRGVFGIHGTASLGDQKSLDAHRTLGDLISLVAVVTFLLALLVWNKRLIPWTPCSSPGRPAATARAPVVSGSIP